jgi:hypothetical protein
MRSDHAESAAGRVRSALVALTRGAPSPRLPLPGSGATLVRWRALAQVAAVDLSLAKLFESHHDALAIQAELGARTSLASDALWAVWAAEDPRARLELRRIDDRRVRVFGRKAWCSGARFLDAALVTAWEGERGPFLIALRLDQPGIDIDANAWRGVGMVDTGTSTVAFEGVEGEPVGACGEYLSRPGFWHGGAGVAACWYGGARRLAEFLRRSSRAAARDHAAAHLGAVDVALSAARAQLREAAAWIDAQPRADAAPIALRTRGVVEAAVEIVSRRVGRALGAAPFCNDETFARLAADLPVFVRQSHAEQDLATLGRLSAQDDESIWAL